MGDRRWRVVTLLLSVVVFTGCTAPDPIPHRVGPDARICQLPDAAKQNVWPSNTLRLSVVRPSFDESIDPAESSLDPRITLAVLDRDEARWVMQGRLDDRQGLALAAQLEQALVLDSLQSEEISQHPIVARVLMPPESGEASWVLPGGHWRLARVRVPTDQSNRAEITLVLETRTGQVAGEASMSPSTARDLLTRLRGAIVSNRY